MTNVKIWLTYHYFWSLNAILDIGQKIVSNWN